MTIDSITVTVRGPQEYATVAWTDLGEAYLHVYITGGLSIFIAPANAQWLADSLAKQLANRPAPPEQLALPFNEDSA